MKYLGALGAMLLSLWVVPPALGTATMSYPADGQTVSLDQQGSFYFRWTLPPGEFGPEVYVGDGPTYDPESFYPFDPKCGAGDPSAVLDSCRPGPPLADPLPAGTHYAFIFTDNGDPTTQNYESPVTRFVVPPMLAWGCGPVARCGIPPVQTAYDPAPAVGPPESDLGIEAWVNSPGAPVVVTFTLRNRHKIVARIRRTATAAWDFHFDPGFMVFQTGTRRPYRTAVRLHGVHGVKWLRVTIVVKTVGLTITRTATMRAPPG